nr:bifunctional pyr operon transcriptional regulator/uracil phosphoribosyltransferase PyrR [Saprospiraceae bacterium]
MEEGKVILEKTRFYITLRRLCEELIENYGDFQDTCLIGLQPRGVFLAERIVNYLRTEVKDCRLEYGKLDITFYRDDYRIREKPLSASPTEINFIVENKKVILVDDVLYTGRSVQAALTALQHYGRPMSVELLALVDRRFNRHLPIRANYVGITVDSVDDAYVRVDWEEGTMANRILLFPKKNE